MITINPLAAALGIEPRACFVDFHSPTGIRIARIIYAPRDETAKTVEGAWAAVEHPRGSGYWVETGRGFALFGREMKPGNWRSFEIKLLNGARAAGLRRTAIYAKGV